MTTSDKVGANAPRKGSLRTSTSGTPILVIPALSRFPPPPFLTPIQANLWIAALSEVPLDVFRSRHLPMMILYVRSVEHMMRVSDDHQKDPDDDELFRKLKARQAFVASIEHNLSFDTRMLFTTIFRANSHMRLANDEKRMKDVADLDDYQRQELMYADN